MLCAAFSSWSALHAFFACWGTKSRNVKLDEHQRNSHTNAIHYSSLVARKVLQQQTCDQLNVFCISGRIIDKQVADQKQLRHANSNCVLNIRRCMAHGAIFIDCKHLSILSAGLTCPQALYNFLSKTNFFFLSLKGHLSQIVSQAKANSAYTN